MKSSITYAQVDDDLLLVTMKFTFDCKGPHLRKRLNALGFKLYPDDKVRMKVSEFVTQTGQTNSSMQDEFTILRHYEITQDFDEHVAAAREHAERYFHRVIKDLGVDVQVLPPSWD